MRERLVARFAGEVADFMADNYGRVTFDGKGQWTATDGGAAFKIGSLSEAEAAAIDYAARKFAYPDA